MPVFLSLLSSAWGFIKAHWQAVLLIVVIAVGYAWVKHRDTLNTQALIDQQHSHQVEIDAINKARADEQAAHEAQLRQLQDSLAKAQSEYNTAMEQLQQQQVVEQQQIVKKYGNDMQGLAELLGSKLGFTVQVPR